MGMSADHSPHARSPAGHVLTSDALFKSSNSLTWQLLLLSQFMGEEQRLRDPREPKTT